jgi:hypothetical protein
MNFNIINHHLYASHSAPALFISTPALFVSTVSTPTLLNTGANLHFKQGINITHKDKFMQPEINVVELNILCP